MSGTLRKIERIKKMVKQELDATAKEGSPDRLRYILKRVAENQSQGNALSQHIYCMSALHHHSRFGGMTLTSVGEVAKVADAALRIEGVNGRHSQKAFLHAELHSLLSKIYRFAGHHWDAVWEEHLSEYLSGGHGARGQAYLWLGIALRNIRVGNLAFGEERLRAAIRGGIEGPSLRVAQLELLKCLRLTSRVNIALRYGRCLQRQDLMPGQRLEVEWEAVCSEATLTQNLQPMMRAVQKGGTHHEFSYVVEAFLWSRAVASKYWITRYPKISSLLSASAGKSDRYHPTMRFVKLFEDIYDSCIPMPKRLADLGPMLGKTERLFSLDQEMLVWSAAARWLARCKAASLANATLGKLQGMSLQITEGRELDSLGTVQDLFQRNWCVSKSGRSAEAQALG